MTKNPKDLTWEEVLELPERTLLYKEEFPGYDFTFIIVKANLCYCAYICVPVSHPCAHYNSDKGDDEHGSSDILYELFYEFCEQTHSGITADSKISPKFLENGKWDNTSERGLQVYGWDYGHGGDALFTYDSHLFARDKKWTVKEIIEDSQSAIETFKNLCRSYGMRNKSELIIEDNYHSRLIDAILEEDE